MSRKSDEYSGDAMYEDWEDPSVPVFYKGNEVGEAFYDEDDDSLVSFELDPEIAALLHRGTIKGFSIKSFN